MGVSAGIAVTVLIVGIAYGAWCWPFSFRCANGPMFLMAMTYGLAIGLVTFVGLRVLGIPTMRLSIKKIGAIVIACAALGYIIGALALRGQGP